MENIPTAIEDKTLRGSDIPGASAARNQNISVVRQAHAGSARASQEALTLEALASSGGASQAPETRRSGGNRYHSPHGGRKDKDIRVRHHRRVFQVGICEVFQ